MRLDVTSLAEPNTVAQVVPQPRMARLAEYVMRVLRWLRVAEAAGRIAPKDRLPPKRITLSAEGAEGGLLLALHYFSHVTTAAFQFLILFFPTIQPLDV
jgi:hypothetical protein